jgi:hypothetical protein
MHRLPRCSPDVALQYREWSIPPGVSSKQFTKCTIIKLMEK